MEGPAGDDEIIMANDSFYEAFEAADMAAMAEVWEQSEAVACTHPGWPTRHGWKAVAASWESIFSGGDPLQFILTDTRVRRHGDTAWVTGDENLVSAEGPGGTVAALNIFERRAGSWLMVAHHGSPVMRR
ncbi:MAG: nuclear transport factor 2 family protein [Acidimicrobiales bacterium]